MAYKHQNEIEDAVDVMVKVMGEEKHGKAQQELAEVYRKAEAWDKLKEIMITTISMHRTSLPVDKYHGNLLKGQRDVLENVKRKMVELENGED